MSYMVNTNFDHISNTVIKKIVYLFMVYERNLAKLTVAQAHECKVWRSLPFHYVI